ncbi:transcription factor rfeH-Penicillium chrysogenum [Penicillium viridicatum]|nr:transcription factor rfeH-Penicillium chrysogenum [Penicillium viridicatum]
MGQSDNHQRSLPRLSITEINGLLSQEQQKQDASIYIRDELVRFNQNQALAQQNTRAAAYMAGEAGRGLRSSVTKQSKTHKVSKQKRMARVLFVVIAATVLKHQNGVVARTLCNACGLHYAKLSRGTGKFVALDDIGIRGKT